MAKIDQVTVALREHVRWGGCQLLARVRLEDRQDVTIAAALLGLTQSQFMRNVLVQAARQIIAEAASESSPNHSDQGS